MPISIDNVARAAGVSITTVSRVLNNSDHRVNQVTRDRVLLAASALGYSPSALARALATRRTQLVGVLVGDTTDPYFASILRGVDDMARAHDYMVLMCNTDREAEVELRYLKLLHDYRADGILFAGGSLTDPDHLRKRQPLLERMREHGTAFVAFGHYGSAVPEINIDNMKAVGEIMSHLIELGHHRIAFIGGSPGVTTSEQRLAGYREALQRAGLPYDPELVLPGNYTYAGGRDAAELLLGLNHRPTAVLAATDVTAIGCLTSLRQRGIGIPAEMSVAGLNDITAAQYVEPPLTTVSVPLREMGMTGMRLILSSLDGKEVEPFCEIPHRLVVRGSTGPPCQP